MQRAFVSHYVANGFNAVAAARSAGYAHPHSVGSQVLAKPRVKAEVKRLMAIAQQRADKATIVSREEALEHLSTILRNKKQRTKDRISAASTIARMQGWDKTQANTLLLAGVVILPANGREPAPEHAGMTEMQRVIDVPGIAS